LTRPQEAWDGDMKHGRDRSVAERSSRPPCRIGRDAYDQFSFPKVTSHIFSMLVFTVVLNASSSSLLLKHGTLCSKYIGLEIEKQLFKMKKA